MRVSRFTAIAALCTLPVYAVAPRTVRAQTENVVPLGATTPDLSAKPIIPLGEIALFNGRNFSGWYTFLPSKGVSNDPEHIFTIEPDRSVHISGKEFGYFATALPYANYRLSFDVKWGEKKWTPRDGATVQRDSGCLVHVFDEDKVWPKSFECQIQERDMGDIFLLGGISAWANGKLQNGRVVRKKENEKPHGEWNTVEIICKNDSVTSIVNGMVENEATRLTRKKDGTGGKLNFGRIALQSEGAEVFYRNIKIRPVE